MAELFAQQVEVALVNPARVRSFAASEGIKAKTDPIDAKVLLRFAQEKKPRATPAPEPIREQLCALLERHAHLSQQIAKEKNRLQNSSERTHASIQRMLTCAQEELAHIDNEIHDLLQSDPSRCAQCEIMQQVVGIGEMTALTILAYLPELTEVNRNQAVALAGLAPYNRDSGKRKAKRRIIGVRAKVRKCLYMAAQSAAVHNPVIKTYVDHLRFEKDKPYKSAIVAAMRKMLIHIQVLLKNQKYELA
jgi:transposase